MLYYFFKGSEWWLKRMINSIRPANTAKRMVLPDDKKKTVKIIFNFQNYSLIKFIMKRLCGMKKLVVI